MDSSQQVGRNSVSTAFDITYKDMTHNCEALLMGKQNMSRLMSTPQNQECLIDFPLQSHDNESKKLEFFPQDNLGTQKVFPCFMKLTTCMLALYILSFHFHMYKAYVSWFYLSNSSLNYINKQCVQRIAV